MSLRKIAKILGISPTYLSLLLNGKRPWRGNLKERYEEFVNTFVNTNNSLPETPSYSSIQAVDHLPATKRWREREGVEPTAPTEGPGPTDLGETKMSQGSPHSATPDMLLGNFLYVHGETKGQILTLSLHKPAYGVGSIFPDIPPDRALDRSTKYAWLDSTSANAIHRAAGHAPGARRCAGRPVLSGRPLRARGGYPRGTGAGPRRWRYR